MRHSARPIITWDAPSANRSDSWHSIVIAMVRALAAIEVAAAHLRALFYPGMRTITDPTLWYQGFAFFTGFAHQAVLLFFVISGWLVGGSLLDKWNQRDALRHYAVDRITRLWTVLIPVFVLSLLLGLGIGQLDGGTFDYAASNEFSVASFFGNLAGLQLISVPAFGGNFPLWSLSNETWYYILFPLLVVTVRTERLGLRTLSALMIALLALALPPLLLLYFMIWLLGAACSRLQLNCGRGARMALIAVAAATSVYFRLTGRNDDLSVASFIPDLILTMIFLAILCSLQNTKAPTAPAMLRIAKTGRYFAEFSFTLYVIHYPLIVLLEFVALKFYGVEKLTPSNPLHLGAYLAMLCFIMVGAWLSYLLFESRTAQIRNWVKRKLLRKAAAVVVPA
jgi:peptidoglycan/LPS O-acetylase OafA/YrhL